MGWQHPVSTFPAYSVICNFVDVLSPQSFFCFVIAIHHRALARRIVVHRGHGRGGLDGLIGIL
jgi:hypothetical protein